LSPLLLRSLYPRLERALLQLLICLTRIHYYQLIESIEDTIELKYMDQKFWNISYDTYVLLFLLEILMVLVESLISFLWLPTCPLSACFFVLIDNSKIKIL
jgi:hypothetical protein